MLYLLLFLVWVELLIIFLIYKEEKDMAAVYVSLIVKGVRTFSSVPKTIKEQVKDLLIALELEYLIDEN